MRILIATALLSAALTANGQSIPTSTDVTYSCTIVTDWLQGLHPTDFPIDAHYSPVIAASHAPGAAYWGPGETASPGLKTQSEMGNPTTLKEELAEGYLITQGSGWYWYRDEPITSRTVFMSQTIEISLDADHSEVTSTMMVAPSPDWFTGFYGVDFTEGGYWKDEVVLETFAWDAGTDSAETYRHENTPTVPQGVITAFDSVNPGPFTPENPMTTWTCGIVVEPTYSVEGEATYSCDFIANFLPSNHPGTEASPHPESFHYSPPVIASHSDTVAYFTAGEAASEGIAVQSTKGNPVPLLDELESLGDLACSAARGAPQWTITDADPTRVFAAQTLGNITVSPSCPVVSLTSMLAPSPDWFTGYSSYVVSETDVWPSTFEFYTNLYDSGVDSGEAFTSADAPTEPVGTVVEITPEVGGVLSRVVEGVTEVLPGALVKCSLTSYSPYPTIEECAESDEFLCDYSEKSGKAKVAVCTVSEKHGELTYKSECVSPSKSLKGTISSCGFCPEPTDAPVVAPTAPVVTPTAAPVIPPTPCFDDPTFRFKQQREKDCDWVAEKPLQRCEKQWMQLDLSEYCPRACGLCGPTPAPTTAPSKEPTTAPTAAPVTPEPTGCDPDLCFDNPDFKHKNDGRKDCKWVSKKTESRCNKVHNTEGYTVQEECPEACALSDFCFDIAINPESTICSSDDKYLCPILCGLCDTCYGP